MSTAYETLRRRRFTPAQIAEHEEWAQRELKFMDRLANLRATLPSVDYIVTLETELHDQRQLNFEAQKRIEELEEQASR